MISELLSKLKPELNRLGVKHSLTHSKMENILTLYFKELKVMITDPRMPKVILTGLGTFKPTVNLINKTLNQLFFWRRKDRSRFNEEKAKIIIERVWTVRHRLMKEKRGQKTFYETHAKKFPGRQVERRGRSVKKSPSTE